MLASGLFHGIQAPFQTGCLFPRRGDLLHRSLSGLLGNLHSLPRLLPHLLQLLPVRLLGAFQSLPCFLGGLLVSLTLIAQRLRSLFRLLLCGLGACFRHGQGTLSLDARLSSVLGFVLSLDPRLALLFALLLEGLHTVARFRQRLPSLFGPTALAIQLIAQPLNL
ncbi:hypothetical protein ACRHM7_17940 [Chromohalobacter israelensis]|uniref:hypothetical protein n=1 Tax=Chromohalobacter israelensis TaxID=141390 RepID=UPI003D7A8D36